MDLKGVLDGTMDAVGKAGELLMGFLGRVVSIQFKGEVDLVTEADRASEALLVKLLGAVLPEASLLAEEGSEIQRSDDLRWIVDPLDGTTNFAHGYPIFCVSVALEHEGNRVLAVVHDPSRGDFFTAIRGEGANLNRDPIRVSPTHDLGDALLVTGFPYDVRTSARNNLLQFSRFLKRARAVRRDGSAALNLAYLAAGRFDGFWEEKLAPWDMAGGALLVEEAGGVVTDYGGNSLNLEAGHLVASNGTLQSQLLEVLAEIEAGGELPPLKPPPS